MYGVHKERSRALSRLTDRDSTSPMMQHLVREVDIVGNMAMESSSVDNEQEREVAFEVERESQTQRPPIAEPLSPGISNGLVDFIKNGVLRTGRNIEISGAFQTLMDTTASEHIRGRKIGGQIPTPFVTKTSYGQSDFHLGKSLMASFDQSTGC